MLKPGKFVVTDLCPAGESPVFEGFVETEKGLWPLFDRETAEKFAEFVNPLCVRASDDVAMFVLRGDEFVSVAYDGNPEVICSKVSGLFYVGDPDFFCFFDEV